MKKKLFTAVCLLAASAAAYGCGKTAPVMTDDAGKEEPAKETPHAINSCDSAKKFGYALFGENIDEKNPVLSPVSAYLALAMADLGADGNTKKAFDGLMGEDCVTLSDDLMDTLPKQSENTVLSLVNSAWIDDRLKAEEKWMDDIEAFVDAEAYQTKLSSASAKDSMNNWIEEKTNGLITNFIMEPLDDKARLALFNTVYFKAKWAAPFDGLSTFEEEFTLKDGKKAKTEMMHNNFYADYLSNDFAEGVILPYRNWEEADGNLAFVALKPKAKEMQVRELYSKLTEETGENLENLLADRQNQLINLKLPKFEITFDKVLNDSLQQMGLEEAFDEDRADFSRLGTTEKGNNLYISLVRQKAKVIVDEEGTEAAAATEVIMAECAVEMEMPVDVFFDEPFLYMIMDMDRELPVFIGILDEPGA